MSFLVDLKILAATVLTLAGQWPVPLSWIVPSRDLEGEPRNPVAVKMRSAPEAGAEPAVPAGLRVPTGVPVGSSRS